MTFSAVVSLPSLVTPSRGDTRLKLFLLLNLEKKTLNSATKNNFSRVSPPGGVTRVSPHPLSDATVLLQVILGHSLLRLESWAEFGFQVWGG